MVHKTEQKQSLDQTGVRLCAIVTYYKKPRKPNEILLILTERIQSNTLYWISIILNASTEKSKSTWESFRTNFLKIHLNLRCFARFATFVSFEKRENQPWRSVTFSKTPTLLKVSLPHRRFSRFLNCANSTKSLKALH